MTEPTMDSFAEFFTDLQLDYGYLIRPLIVGTLVSIVCSVIGCFIVLRRMSFLADAIAHSMLAGVIGGYLLMKVFYQQDSNLTAMLIGAIFSGILTVAMVGFVTTFSRVKQDTAIGIMYTGIFAFAAFFISLESVSHYIQIDIYHFIIGDVMAVDNSELWLLAIVASIVLPVVILFYRPLQLTTFDPIMAAAIGIPVMLVEYLLTACTSLVVVSGVQIAGVILVVALIITPAATAYLLTDRLDRMIIASAIVGVIGFWLGFAIAVALGTEPGATVVVTMTAMFLLGLAFAPKYGLLADWIRKNNTVPQEMMEDVLGCVLRAKGKSVPVAEVLKHIKKPAPRVKKSIAMLERQGLLDVDDETVLLTDDGRFQAKRLVRAHRLWETYLDRTGTPKELIHDKAHQLEHLSDAKTVEYLDDKLGHPLTDPHGSIIPNESELVFGKDLMLSLLRSGNQAKIVAIKDPSMSPSLTIGQEIEVGPRAKQGQLWTVITQDENTLNLTHQQADAVIVRLLRLSSSASPSTPQS